LKIQSSGSRSSSHYEHLSARDFLRGGRQRDTVAAMGTSAPRRTAVLAVLIATAAGGCGSSHKSPPQEQVARQQVTQTVRSYLRAQVAGDGQAACALLTASGQQELITLVVQAGKGLVTSRPSCQYAVALVRAVAGATILTALGQATVEAVNVAGSRATALVTAGTAFPNEQVSLQKVGMTWKIASVPGLSSLG
jgi:hypothetical protein